MKQYISILFLVLAMTSFASKKHILLTGEPGIGKSTIVKKVISQLPKNTSGVYAEEERVEGIRRGFVLHTLDGKKDYLAHCDFSSAYRVGPYGVNVEAIRSLVIPAITSSDSTFIVIDEIGPMQLSSSDFILAVTRAMDSGKTVFGTIASDGFEEIKSRDDVQIIEVTLENRDALPSILTDQFLTKVCVYQREEVLPVLPLLYRWSLAFQQEPYAFAGVHPDDVIDSQDVMYVNEKNALVVVARLGEEVIGVGAGIAMDSRYVQNYFGGFYPSFAEAGYDVSKMFYITYILTMPACESALLFEKFEQFAAQIERPALCYMQDSKSALLDPSKWVETWMLHVDGFKKMPIAFKKSWPTFSFGGAAMQEEHVLDFFIRS